MMMLIVMKLIFGIEIINKQFEMALEIGMASLANEAEFRKWAYFVINFVINEGHFWHR
jgi:hypothetical protein